MDNLISQSPYDLKLIANNAENLLRKSLSINLIEEKGRHYLEISESHVSVFEFINNASEVEVRIKGQNLMFGEALRFASPRDFKQEFGIESPEKPWEIAFATVTKESVVADHEITVDPLELVERGTLEVEVGDFNLKLRRVGKQSISATLYACTSTSKLSLDTSIELKVSLLPFSLQCDAFRSQMLQVSLQEVSLQLTKQNEEVGIEASMSQAQVS